MVSAPAVRVTVLQEPKVPQVAPVSGAEARSTTPEVGSTPDWASLPLFSVSGTEVVVYHGPPASATERPVGPLESATIEIRTEFGRPAPLVVSIERVDGVEAPDVQV